MALGNGDFEVNAIGTKAALAKALSVLQQVDYMLWRTDHMLGFLRELKNSLDVVDSVSADYITLGPYLTTLRAKIINLIGEQV